MVVVTPARESDSPPAAPTAAPGGRAAPPSFPACPRTPYQPQE